MKKVWAIGIAFLLVGVLVGFGSGFWFRQGDVDTAFASGMVYQESITPVAVTPASLLCTLNESSIVDLSTFIDTGGNVTTEGSDVLELEIENTDEERTATDLTIRLTNPVTGKEGLHDNLEVDALEISITVGSVTSALYHDGTYSTGIVLGDLGAGGKITIDVTWTAEVCVAGTFQDGQNYTCGLYIYQPDANYVDTVAYHLRT